MMLFEMLSLLIELTAIFIFLFFASFVCFFIWFIIQFLFANRSETDKKPFWELLGNKFSLKKVFKFAGILLLIITTFRISFIATQHIKVNHILKHNISKSNKIIVRTGGFCHRDKDNEKTLLEINSQEEIADFLKLISLQPSINSYSCACCGELSFEFYDEKDNMTIGFSFHHGSHIRLNNSSFRDKYLTNKSRLKLKAWLAERNCSEYIED